MLDTKRRSLLSTSLTKNVVRLKIAFVILLGYHDWL